MKEQFVTHEIALELKKLGFDEPCFGHFTKDMGLKIHIQFENIQKHYTNSKLLALEAKYLDMPKNRCASPLWQQAIDWVFEKLEINYPYLRIEMYSDGSGEWYHPADEGVKSLTIMFDTKEEAVLKAIELIKNGSTQKTKTD